MESEQPPRWLGYRVIPSIDSGVSTMNRFRIEISSGDALGYEGFHCAVCLRRLIVVVPYGQLPLRLSSRVEVDGCDCPGAHGGEWEARVVHVGAVEDA